MATFQIIGMSDRGECDCCGKTNLKRTVHMVSGGAAVFYGVNCASTAMRQKYQGKKLPVSTEAIKSMAARARREFVSLESAI